MLNQQAVLLAIMLWGSVWGVTGMVLAVPMTAVARIYLASIDHPLPRYLASVLAGTVDELDEAVLRNTARHQLLRDAADEHEVEAPADTLEEARRGHGMVPLAKLR